jgi:ABC-2 type transport system ATP-binding protein
VRELSGGMKRRLSLGISLVGDPSIVFLDEPTTGLDPENKRQIWEILSSIIKLSRL